MKEDKARTPSSTTQNQALPQGPRLVMLKEREQQLLARASENEVETSGIDTGCFSIGPFQTQADVRLAFNTLASFVEKSRQRQLNQTQDRGFWVYLPAVETREQALGLARDLAAVGISDYYVVTAGDQENTVSLGLCREEGKARRRQASLNTLGFDARVAQRTEETVVYWLDYSVAFDKIPPWERVVASRTGLDRRQIQCFR